MKLPVRRLSGKAARKRSQQGYALIVVSLMATLMLLSVIAAAPSIRTENQREKEQEMIWRGKQYVRGIKLYYRKMGRFPTSLDDLTKPKVGSVRFMRQAYKDPMNAEDGTWRLIYVGPAGQLIGSLKPPQTFQLPSAAGTQGTASPNSASSPSGFGQSSFGQSSLGQSSFGQSNSGGTGFGQGGAQPAGSTQTQNPASQTASAANSQNSNTADDGSAAAGAGISSDSPVFGGNIIGIGSKINKRSVIIYEDAKNYRLFEFVWNPSKDLMNAIGQAATPVATPNAPGQGQGTGFGNGTGFGTGTGFGQPGNNPSNQPNQPNPPTMPEPTPGQPPPQQQP